MDASFVHIYSPVHGEGEKATPILAGSGMMLSKEMKTSLHLLIWSDARKEPRRGSQWWQFNDANSWLHSDAGGKLQGEIVKRQMRLLRTYQVPWFCGGLDIECRTSAVHSWNLSYRRRCWESVIRVGILEAWEDSKTVKWRVALRNYGLRETLQGLKRKEERFF